MLYRLDSAGIFVNPVRYQKPWIQWMLWVLLIGMIVSLLFQFHLSQNDGNKNMAGVKRIVTAEKLNRPETESISFQPGVLRYLENGFYNEELGPAGEWWHWIIIDDGSKWTIGKLRMTRQALLNTIAALDEAGLDGQAILSGYRFRLANRHFIDGEYGHQGNVNHEEQVITLADSAFLGYQGFIIYHELGHVVDHRLERALTAATREQMVMQHDQDDPAVVQDGFWLREQTHHSPSEAAADAFALWVLVAHAGYDMPTFSSTPDWVDTGQLFSLVESGIR